MKRVLVISYYWPPSGGISVLRSLKIVKYLRNYGWEPVVFVPSNAHYPYLDSDNQKDVPDNIEIIRFPIMEPFKLFKILTGRKSSDPLNSIVQIQDKKSSRFDRIGIYIRANFFIPDARYLWIKPSVKYLWKYLKKHPVDAIFTDGPPHTNTSIGNLLKKSTGIPWLSDYQDPWTQADYFKLFPLSKRALKKHEIMEQECLGNADKITIASPSWKNDLEGIGANNVDVIYYGYDEDDFMEITVNKDNSHFEIVHTGLLGYDRHPDQLMKVLNDLDETKPIRLNLVGQVDQLVLQEIRKNAGKVIINEIGTVPRKLALQHTMNADLLLLPLNKADNAAGRLPGKLYEYLRAHCPILALGPPDSDASRILKETKTGICAEYNDITAQRKFIKEFFSQRKQFSPDLQKIEFYSNENQTKMIAFYLDQIS